MDKLLHGSERKLRLSMKPLGDIHFADCKVRIEAFVYTNKSVSIDESRILKVDEDSYDILLCTDDAVLLGKGDIKLRVYIGIPDGDFPDEYRNQIYEVCMN